MQTDKHDVDLFSRSLAADIIIRRRFLKKIGHDGDNDPIETCVCVCIYIYVPKRGNFSARGSSRVQMNSLKSAAMQYICAYMYIYMYTCIIDVLQEDKS